MVEMKGQDVAYLRGCLDSFFRRRSRRGFWLRAKMLRFQSFSSIFSPQYQAGNSVDVQRSHITAIASHGGDVDVNRGIITKALHAGHLRWAGR